VAPEEVTMSVPETVASFLRNNDVEFELVSHRRTSHSMETAQAAHIPGNRIAKAVLLEDGDRYVMAVLPASHRLDPDAVAELLACDIHFVEEEDFGMLFRDCRVGAIPPVGPAYGIKTVVDDAILRLPDVYLESGDHEHLIHVEQDAFMRMMGAADHGHISYHV
jgi:Ala-tRNA(Pro) deacylase